jgi:hypothetical protein
MLDRSREDRLRLVETAPGIQHVVDLRSVLGPFLDLIEITVVRDQWLVSLVVGPFAHCASRKALLRKNATYFLHRSIQRRRHQV